MVFGNRRLKTYKELEQEGLQLRVPVIIHDMTDLSEEKTNRAPIDWSSSDDRGGCGLIPEAVLVEIPNINNGPSGGEVHDSGTVCRTCKPYGRRHGCQWIDPETSRISD